MGLGGFLRFEIVDFLRASTGDQEFNAIILSWNPGRTHSIKVSTEIAFFKFYTYHY